MPVKINHRSICGRPDYRYRFLEARKSGELFIEKDIERAHLHPCEKCGQPTSAPGLCSFCRTMEKVNSVPAP